jgi:hypothetical protein
VFPINICLACVVPVANALFNKAPVTRTPSVSEGRNNVFSVEFKSFDPKRLLVSHAATVSPRLDQGSSMQNGWVLGSVETPRYTREGGFCGTFLGRDPCAKA